MIDRAHDLTMDPSEGMSHSDIVEQVSCQQLSALRALYPVLADINGYSDWGVEMGQDVTLHRPNACKDHKYQVVIEAPKPFEATKKQISDLPVVIDGGNNQ